MKQNKKKKKRKKERRISICWQETFLGQLPLMLNAESVLCKVINQTYLLWLFCEMLATQKLSSFPACHVCSDAIRCRVCSTLPHFRSFSRLALTSGFSIKRFPVHKHRRTAINKTVQVFHPQPPSQMTHECWSLTHSESDYQSLAPKFRLESENVTLVAL